MALFSRFSRDIHPFFRYMDDATSPDQFVSTRTTHRVFQPNFDVHETKEAYILDGELPGVIDKNHIQLEFTDAQTLVVKGRVERSVQEDNISATNGGGGPSDANDTSAKSKQARVEDESQQQQQQHDGALTTTTTGNQSSTVSKYDTSGRKYWISERSIGEFQRSFSFPAHIDQDGVKAKLNHGILTVTVPKIQPKGSRKINVE